MGELHPGASAFSPTTDSNRVRIRLAKIPRIKKMACGFRNRDRFRTAILFHLGGLDLYPASATHTKS